MSPQATEQAKKGVLEQASSPPAQPAANNPSYEALAARVASFGSKDIVQSVEMSGNPLVGTVQLIKQIHNVEGLSFQPKKTVGEYQFEILKLLLREKPLHVFWEGMSEAEAKAVPLELGEPLGEIIGSKRIPEKPSDPQLWSIASSGAAEVYRRMNPGAFLHLTETAQEREVNDRESEAFPERRREIIYDRREQQAMSKVMAYLAEHPGQTVYLIYGAGHRWGPEDLPEARRAPADRPQIVARDIPGLQEKDAISSELLKQLARFPDLEARLIAKTNYFDAHNLPFIGSDDNFRGALLKADLNDKFSYRIHDLLEQLQSSPRRQEIVIDSLFVFPPHALRLLPQALQEKVVKEKPLRGTDSQFALGVLEITDPRLEANVVAAATTISLKLPSAYNSKEAELLSRSLTPRREATQNVIFESRLGTEEDTKKRILAAPSLSPGVFEKLKSADLQRAALTKITFETDRERQVFDSHYFRIHSKDPSVFAEAAVKLKLFPDNRSDDNPRTNLSEPGAIIDELLLFEHSAEAQRVIVQSVTTFPVFGLQLLSDDATIKLAVNKLPQLSPLEREILSQRPFLSFGSGSNEIMAEIAERVGMSGNTAAMALAYSEESPAIQMRILARSTEIPFAALGSLRSEDAQKAALPHLLPPASDAPLEFYIRHLSPEIRKRVIEKFPAIAKQLE